MAFIYISQIVRDVEHISNCLFPICLSSLVKCLFASFAHFLIGLFVSLLLRESLTKVSLFNIHFGIPDVLNKNSDQMDTAYENG